MKKIVVKNPKKDNRLKCIYAKEITFGDIKCTSRSTLENIEYCEYGKGICKNYTKKEI